MKCVDVLNEVEHPTHWHVVRSAEVVFAQGQCPGYEKRKLTTAQMIEEFHETYGQARRYDPVLEVPEKELRVELIKEEAKEFVDAVADNDLVEVADALGDIVYVAYGAALTFGIDLDAVIKEIHDSNMSKLSADMEPILREDGKVLKGPNYFKPNIRSVLGLKDD